MSKTAAEVIASARAILADTYDEAFNATDLLDWLNEGQQRFAAETHCCQKITTKAVTSPTTAFSTLLSAEDTVQELLLIGRVERSDGSVLPKAPLTESKTKQASGVVIPTRYSVFADTLILDLVSDPAENLTVYYSYVPVKITNTATVLTIPDQYEGAIVKYIVFCGHLQMRDAGLANGAFGEYELIKNQAVNLTALRAN